uniref:Coiled-coil domain containing 88B n=1 Tax=Myotis lucifugus TaxID=59463 RepID=G1Q2R7_MYOLU
QVTRHQESLLDLQWLEVPDMALEEVEYLSSSMTCRLRRVLIEQDHCRKVCLWVAQQPGGRRMDRPPARGHFPCRAQSPETPEWNTSSRPSEDTHLAMELADTKATLRGVRQELEEKTKQLADTRNQLYQLVLELQEARHNNMELAARAQASCAPVPELDSLREKANRVERLEMEAMGLRQKQKDIVEFYASRMKELIEDNFTLMDTKGLLQEQLTVAWSRVDKLYELEEENVQLKSKLRRLHLIQAQDTDQKHLEELQEENLALKAAQRQSVEESAHLRWELDQLSEAGGSRTKCECTFVWLVYSSASSCFLKLDQEKQSLQGTIQGMQDASLALQESSLQRRELEEENQQLSKQIEDLRVQMEREKQTNQDLETLCEELMEEREQLLCDIETLKAERAQEIKDLEQVVLSLRESSQASSEACLQDIENENKVLHQTVMETSSRVSKLEWERQQLHQDLEQVKEQAARVQELEQELHRLQEENEKLAMEVSTLTTAPERVHTLERESQDLLLENQRLQTSLDTLQPEGLERDKQLFSMSLLNFHALFKVLREGTQGGYPEKGHKLLKVENSTLCPQSASLTALIEKNTQLQHQQLAAAHEALQREHACLGALHEHLSGEHEALMDEYSRQKTLLRRTLELESKVLSDSDVELVRLETEGQEGPPGEKDLEQRRRELSTFCACELSLLSTSLASVSADARQRLGLPWEQLRCRDLASQGPAMPYDNRVDIFLCLFTWWHLTALREEFIVLPMTPCLMDLLCDSMVFAGWTDSWRPLVCLQHGCKLKVELTLDWDTHSFVPLVHMYWVSSLVPRIQWEVGLTVSALPEGRYLDEKDRRPESPAEPPPPPSTSHVLSWQSPPMAKGHTKERLSSHSHLSRCLSLSTHRSWLQAEVTSTADMGSGVDTSRRGSGKGFACLGKIGREAVQDPLQTETGAGCAAAPGDCLGPTRQASGPQAAWLRAGRVVFLSWGGGLTQDPVRGINCYGRWNSPVCVVGSLRSVWSSENSGFVPSALQRKAAHPGFEVSLGAHSYRYKDQLQHKVALEQLGMLLTTEREALQQEQRTSTMATKENQRLQGELDSSVSFLYARYKGLKGQQEELQVHSKKLQTSLNDTLLEVNCWQDQCNWLREELQSRDISLTELGNHCQLLSHLKGNLEGENRHLQSQNQRLKEQNQRLLQEDVENKDQHQEHQRQYVDKLNALQRQNETLEEKSIAQRKFHDPAPKKKKHWIGAKFLLKLIKLKKGGSRERRKSTSERPSWPLESSDQALPSTSQPLQWQLEPLQATPCCSKRENNSGPLGEGPGDLIPKGVAPPRGSLDRTSGAASTDPATTPRPSELGSGACSSSAINTILPAPPLFPSSQAPPTAHSLDGTLRSSSRHLISGRHSQQGSREGSWPGSSESHRHASSDGSLLGLKGKPGRLHRKPKSSEDLMPSRDTALCPTSRCQHTRTHYPQPPGVPATQNGPLHQEASRRGVWPSPGLGVALGPPERWMITLEEFLEERDR